MQRGTIELLPEEARLAVDRLLLERRFSDYSGMAEEINTLLKDFGLEIAVSRSSLHRYGQKFEERMEALRLGSQQAIEMKKLLSDEDSAVAEMSIQLAQSLMFNLMIERGEQLTPKEMSLISKALADSSKAGIEVKKYQAEVQTRTQAAAEAVKDKAIRGGLSEEVIREIEEQILGISR